MVRSSPLRTMEAGEPEASLGEEEEEGLRSWIPRQRRRVELVCSASFGPVIASSGGQLTRRNKKGRKK